jgi:ABC-type sugar transport system substrate-binding protein
MRDRISCALALAFLFTVGCGKNDSPPGGPTGATGTPPKKTNLKIGYVLHGQNDFTQVIKKGAEDARKALGVDVEIVAPSQFVGAQAIALLEGMVQKGKDGVAVVPMQGETWLRPIKEATDRGVPVLTANMISPDSAAAAWMGQDEYQSGVILAQEMRKALEAAGKTQGKIVLGICAPAEKALQDRYKGFVKGMEGTQYSLTQAYDVGTENTKNYGQWENLAGANRDLVAMVGLCSMDIPNMAKLKQRSKASWLIGGYDLNPETLDAIKAGLVSVTLGQHPYLQGYLPVRALVEHLRDGKPLPKGWVDVGTEVVTRANVEDVYKRETDEAAETQWYAEHMKKNFADLSAIAKAMPADRR